MLDRADHHVSDAIDRLLLDDQPLLILQHDSALLWIVRPIMRVGPGQFAVQHRAGTCRTATPSPEDRTQLVGACISAADRGLVDSTSGARNGRSIVKTDPFPTTLLTLMVPPRSCVTVP